MRALDAMPEVEKTSIFGTAVHAVLRSRDVDARRDRRARWPTPGVTVVALRVVEPSLEDVFLDVARTERRMNGVRKIAGRRRSRSCARSAATGARC